MIIEKGGVNTRCGFWVNTAHAGARGVNDLILTS